MSANQSSSATPALGKTVPNLPPSPPTSTRSEQVSARVKHLQQMLRDAKLEKRVAVLQVKNLTRARDEKERQIGELDSELSRLISATLRMERQIRVLGQSLEWDEKLITLEHRMMRKKDVRIDELEMELTGFGNEE